MQAAVYSTSLFEICQHEQPHSSRYLNKRTRHRSSLVIPFYSDVPPCPPPPNSFKSSVMRAPLQNFVLCSPGAALLLWGALCPSLSLKSLPTLIFPVTQHIDKLSAGWPGPVSHRVPARQGLSAQILRWPFEVDLMEALSRLVHLSRRLLCARGFQS